eukprot:TRINITY_DN1475_c1_g1_i1.p1 TRINITY_DN1475_c1_g1~~TRINITY_DN1475_c1_g1_i1.p1  ORF type:complete len:305 (+),score=106.60 TRINITY_DN1475_c1_g1_i1:66-980(+)
MDVVLELWDNFIFDYCYPISWSRDMIFRQMVSLYFILTIGGWLLYLTLASFSYFFIFNKNLKKHKLYIPNQPLFEILTTLKSIPVMALLTVGFALGEVRGTTKLYHNISDYGWSYWIFSILFFLFFTDMSIYWIHRWLHIPFLYRNIHKPHHAWIIATPFASHAFHPFDGFSQSVPYHIFPLLFPLHNYTFLALFVFVNIWTVSIHDGDYQVPNFIAQIINGSAHHTDHHIYFKYNYGQFFTLWDKIGNSYRDPTFELVPLKSKDQLKSKSKSKNLDSKLNFEENPSNLVNQIKSKQRNPSKIK